MGRWLGGAATVWASSVVTIAAVWACGCARPGSVAVPTAVTPVAAADGGHARADAGAPLDATPADVATGRGAAPGDAGRPDAASATPEPTGGHTGTDGGFDAGRDAAAAPPTDAGTDAGAPPPAACAMTVRCDSQIPDEPKITCSFTLADGNGAIEFDDHVGIELHGRSSLTFPKKNYSIELRDATGADKATDLLQMGKESDWILDGMWADRSLMRNALIFDAFRGLGGLHYAPKGRYCTLALNGQPQGIYRVEEKIKRDDDRVNITADDGSGTSFVIKQDSGGVVTLSIGEEDHWEIVYPNQDKATKKQIAGVQAWLNALGKAMDNPTDPKTGLLTLLDRDATVDWMLFQEMMKNIDAYNLSLYFSRDAGGLARPIPWDFDLSLGQPTVQGDTSVPANDQPGGWILHHTRLSKALGSDPDIVQQLGPRWRALRAGPLATAALLSRLDAYGVTLTADSVAQNFTIWPLAQINYTQTWAPYSLYPVSSYADEVSKLRAYLTARLDWIDAHIDNYPN